MAGADDAGRCSMRRQSSRSAIGLKVTPEGRSYVIKVALHLGEPEQGRHDRQRGRQPLCRHAARMRRSTRPSGDRLAGRNGWTSCARRSRPPRGRSSATARTTTSTTSMASPSTSNGSSTSTSVSRRCAPTRPRPRQRSRRSEPMRATASTAARGGARGAVVADDHQSARAGDGTAQGGVGAAQHLRRASTRGSSASSRRRPPSRARSRRRSTGS